MTTETNDELITALYCRLSVEDEKDKRVSDDESNSISNQKQILLDYCKKHGFKNTMFFVDDGISGTNLVRQTENKKLRLSVERGGKRISEIDKLIEKVFEQNAAGILSDERFSKLLQNYECEQKRLQTEIEEWKAVLDDVGQKVTDLRLLLHTLREITEIKELTPTLVNTLIERIEVHNNDKSSGHCYVKVDVYFTAVGMIDIPTEQEILAMMEEMQKNPQQFRFIA